MKKLLLLITLLLFVTPVLKSNQTFTTDTKTKTDYYYHVPVQLEITETGTPTDFIVGYSCDNGVTRTLITPEPIKWGTFNPTGKILWIPDEITTGNSCGIGIVWGERGQTLEDYDIEHVVQADDLSSLFSISPGVISFNQSSTSDSLERLGKVNLSFNYEESTLPDKLMIQYKLEGTNTWIDLKEIQIDRTKDFMTYTFLNDMFYDPSIRVKFRITYIEDGSGYGYNLTSTNWKSIKYNKLVIANRQSLESTLFNSHEPILINFNEKVNFIDEHNVIQVYGDYLDNVNLNTYNGLVQYNEMSHSFIPQDHYTGKVKLSFVTGWYDTLTTVTVEVQDKYLTLSPLSSKYEVNNPVVINWSNSSNFDGKQLIILVSNDGGTSYNVLTSGWNVDKGPFIAYFSTPQTVQFILKISDDWTTIQTPPSSPVIIGEVCKEDSLQTVIEGLNEDIDNLLSDITGYNHIIDSLTNIIDNYEPEYVMVTLVKDLPTDVTFSTNINVQQLQTLITIDGVVTLNDELFDGKNWIYITNLSGQVVFENQNYMKNTGTLNINVGSYISSLYIVYIISEDNQIKSFKFVKN